MTRGDPPNATSCAKDANDTKYTEVPPSALSREALRGLIEEFVTRDGTDYGEHEQDMEQKVARVLLQLERGEARIVIDAETESVTLLSVDRS